MYCIWSKIVYAYSARLKYSDFRSRKSSNDIYLQRFRRLLVWILVILFRDISKVIYFFDKITQ